MPSPTLPKAAYRGRRDDRVPRTFTLTREADTLLREMDPNSKGFGVFISSLIVAEHARRKARQDALAAVQSALAPETHEDRP